MPSETRRTGVFPGSRVAAGRVRLGRDVRDSLVGAGLGGSGGIVDAGLARRDAIAVAAGLVGSCAVDGA